MALRASLGRSGAPLPRGLGLLRAGVAGERRPARASRRSGTNRTVRQPDRAHRPPLAQRRGVFRGGRSPRRRLRTDLRRRGGGGAPPRLDPRRPDHRRARSHNRSRARAEACSRPRGGPRSRRKPLTRSRGRTARLGGRRRRDPPRRGRRCAPSARRCEALAAALVGLAALAVGSTIPLAPGGVGLAGVGMALALEQIGIAPPTAVAAAVTFHALETAASLAFGSSGWVALQAASGRSATTWAAARTCSRPRSGSG